MYKGRYDKQTPPGYSGVAFAEEAAEDAPVLDNQSSPTPVENGAGEKKPTVCKRAPFFKGSTDSRNEVRRMPRDFSGTSEERVTPSLPTNEVAKAESVDLLDSLFRMKFSLEDLLLIGTAILLATKEEDSEAFPFFALTLMLLGSQ